MFLLYILVAVFFFILGYGLPEVSPARRAQGLEVNCPSNFPTKCAQTDKHLDKIVCYCIVKKPMRRIDASNFCRENGMELISIESSNENDFAYHLATTYGMGQVWTSGFREHPNESDSKWVWNGDPSRIRPITFTDWCPNEPDNRNKDEHFMAIINECWHDVPGKFNWSSICEFEDTTLNPNIVNTSSFTFEIGSKQAFVPCLSTDPRGTRMDVSKKKPVDNDNCWSPYEKIVFNNTVVQEYENHYEYDPNKGFIIHYVSTKDRGTFSCSATKGNIKVLVYFDINIVGVEISGPMNLKQITEGEKVVLTCTSYGVYSSSKTKSNLEWYFTDFEERVEAKFDPDDHPGSNLTSYDNDAMLMHTSKLIIPSVTVSSSGSYKCFVQTNKGSYSKSVDLEVVSIKTTVTKPTAKEVDTSTVVASVVSSLLCVVLFACIVVFILFYKRRRKFEGLYSLLRGNSNLMNPDLPLHEQTELLPYDARWEFPLNRLELGKQLGTGCFGRVVQGTAVGIRGTNQTHSVTKTVAVKTTRLPATVVALEALISELKILIHLGFHVNVVNLLGACTTRINRGELYVIVEYCHKGNLRTYLINHRNTFVNQVNQSGDLIRSSYEDPEDLQEFVEYQTIDDEDKGEAVVTTRKLICWSFQIARGMEYLGSKKVNELSNSIVKNTDDFRLDFQVIHGDLACRNILLSENDLVKVADFGLSHQLYKDENYLKNSQGLLPVKWMAIESLTDRIYSTRSDVWSYGIVLWEIFSLGQMPYPDLDDNLEFIQNLKTGYRMEKPDNMPTCVTQVMESCWKTDPNQRPTFSHIEQALSSQLESTVTSYYLQLGDELVRNHVERMNSKVINMEVDDVNKHGHNRYSTPPTNINNPTRNSRLSQWAGSCVLIRLATLGRFRRLEEVRHSDVSTLASSMIYDTADN